MNLNNCPDIYPHSGDCAHCGRKSYKGLFESWGFRFVRDERRRVALTWRSVRGTWGRVFVYCSNTCQELDE